MNPCEYHVPVLLEPSVDGLNICPSGTYVDVTLGGGGHSREILRRIGPEGRLFSFDQDGDAIARAQGYLADHPSPQWTLVQSNFRYLKNWMRYYGVEQVDGVLADLGVSSHHFDEAERGFSFRTDAPLDMRMNQQAGQTAADVVNTYSTEQLTSLFRIYGELRQAPRLAAAIVKARQRQEIRTTGQLAELLMPLMAPAAQKKDLARAFQALRMEVNHEMDALREMLQAATELLRPGGRLVVMSYHSLEDRMVKNFIKTGNVEGNEQRDVYGNNSAPLKAVNRKPILPAEEEIQTNTRARSAKLRIAEKI